MNKKRVLLLSAVLLILILLLRKCEFNNSVNRTSDFLMDQSYFVIPPEATIIAALNTSNILKELDFETLRRTDSYIQGLNEFYAQNPPFTLVFHDPVNAGIDTSGKVIFYISVGTKAEEVYSNSIFKLKSSQAFTKMAERSKRGEIEDKGVYKVMQINAQSSVAWNEDFVSFLSTQESNDKSNIFDNCFIKSRKKYFDENEKFLNYINSSNSDISFWMDLTSYSRNQMWAKGESGGVSSLFLKGNTIYGDADFSKGEIEVDIKFDFNKLFHVTQNKLFKQGFDSKMLSIIPDNSPSFLLSASLNLEGILSLVLNDVDLKVKARNSLVDYGLTFDDLYKAFTGEMLIATYPSSIPEKSGTIFAVKIASQSHFQELMKVWEDLGKIEHEDKNQFLINTGVVPLFPIAATYPDQLQRMLILDNMLYVSLDKSIIDYIKEGSRNNAISDNYLLQAKSSDIMLSGYVNNRFRNGQMFSEEYSLDEMKFNYENNELNLKFEFNDKNTSSLKQILSLKN